MLGTGKSSAKARSAVWLGCELEFRGITSAIVPKTGTSCLNTGSIAGAALDVTATEPLPSDSPLWDAKNIVITPHAAGGRPVNPEELIAHNIRAFRTGAAESEYRNRF